jgi:hypothetical protein
VEIRCGHIGEVLRRSRRARAGAAVTGRLPQTQFHGETAPGRRGSPTRGAALIPLKRRLQRRTLPRNIFVSRTNFIGAGRSARSGLMEQADDSQRRTLQESANAFGSVPRQPPCQAACSG